MAAREELNMGRRLKRWSWW